MVKILERVPSVDGATRYLLELADSLRVEAVFLVMDHVGKDSLCVSSQVGCTYTCRFCSTGLIGYKRDLTADEIVDQVTSVLSDRGFTATRKFDIKYMGMGEPLLNIDAVIESKNRLQQRFPDFTFHLSTVGLASKIRELAARSPNIGLQISLHAPTDELRTRIMPINTTYPIAEVLAAGEMYAAASPLPVTLNYCMMRGVNDRPEHAAQLAELVRGRPLRVQLVNFNPHVSVGYAPADDAQIELFLDTLSRAGVAVHHGLQLGKRSGAGCGQLDANYRAGELKRRATRRAAEASS
jgi:23S rRNA (adenine2503-C2)-methyltransferase